MVWSLVQVIVLTLPCLLESRERSELVRSEFSHWLPGQGSMMSVTRLYPGHSTVGYNDTYMEPGTQPGAEGAGQLPGTGLDSNSLGRRGSP